MRAVDFLYLAQITGGVDELANVVERHGYEWRIEN
jgi:hypothetical protein